MNHPVDKLELASYLSGDCSTEQTTLIEKHISGCVSCRRYLQELKEERREFLAAHPFESLNLPGQHNVRRFPVPRIPALAASLVLLTIGGYVLHSLQPRQSHRIKGDTALSLYVRTAAGSVESRKNHAYHPGERIQITYSCGEFNRLILLSIDQEGRISTYYPVDADTSLVVEKGRDIPLPNSIELDSYLGKELYMAVFSKSALSLPDVVERTKEAYDRADSLSDIEMSLGGDIAVRTLMITKQEATR